MASIHQEQSRYFCQQAFRHTIEQHKQDADDDLLHREFGDKRLEHIAHSLCDIADTGYLTFVIFSRTRKDIVVPQPKGNKQTCHTIEHQTPREGDAVAPNDLQISCNHHQDTLSENRGQTIERRTDSHKVSLVMLIESQHIESVGSNIVGSTGKCHHPEEEQSSLQPERCRNGERHTSEGSTNEQLHGDNPPAFCLHQINEGTPQGFDYPWQIEP